MDAGIKLVMGIPVSDPLPSSWLGKRDAPPGVPMWALIPGLSTTQIRNLIAQIGYNKSQWDYSKVGNDNRLGRYQFASDVLEGYGLLVPGANAEYGSDCVNYSHCWSPQYVRRASTSYSSYMYNTTSLSGFLTNTIAQEHLAYQYLYDLYTNMTKIRAITLDDNPETLGGMLYVGWELGSGTAITHESSIGAGAYAWRYSGAGNGSAAFVAGKYATGALSL